MIYKTLHRKLMLEQHNPNAIEVVVIYCKTIEVVVIYCRNGIEVVVIYCRNAIEVVVIYCRNAIEVVVGIILSESY